MPDAVERKWTMRRALVLAAMGLSLSACFDEPRLKADTESNFKTSFATNNKALSIDDNEKLDAALKDIVLVQTGRLWAALRGNCLSCDGGETRCAS
jgi:hypothetical protein